MRRTEGWNIHGVLAWDWSVQWAIPKGSAAIGSVLPREKSGVDSVPWRMLTASRVFLKADGAFGSMDEAGAALAEAVVSEIKVDAMAAMLVVLRKDLRLEAVLL